MMTATKMPRQEAIALRTELRKKIDAVQGELAGLLDRYEAGEFTAERVTAIEEALRSDLSQLQRAFNDAAPLCF